MMDRLVEQMKEVHGVTEELKMQDQMAWVGKMNNIRACAEEIVIINVIYVQIKNKIERRPLGIFLKKLLVGTLHIDERVYDAELLFI